MAEDLGTWAPEQATVLLEVLQQAGLAPQAKRTREGIVVTVPSEQSDEAHRQLVANMDAIARAARSGGSGSRRRPQAQRGARKQAEGSSPLTSERFLRRGRPLAILIVGVMLVAIIPGPLRWLVLALTVGGLLYVLGKQDPKDGK